MEPKDIERGMQSPMKAAPRSHRPAAMLVTYSFPPVNTAGVHRPVALLRNLAKNGWRVTVLTAEPDNRKPCDPSLVEDFQGAVKVIRSPSPDLPGIAARLIKRRPKPGGPSRRAAARQPSQPGRPGKPATMRKRLIDWASWWLHVPDSVAGWFFPALRSGLHEMRQEHPDVLFATGPPWTSLILAATLSWLRRVPLVADFRDPWHEIGRAHV